MSVGDVLNPPPMSPEEAFFLISGLADAHSPLRGDGTVQRRIFF